MFKTLSVGKSDNPRIYTYTWVARQLDECGIKYDAQGRKPERAYKGSFNVRLSPDLHRRIAVYAMERDMSLNQFVERSIEKGLSAGVL